MAWTNVGWGRWMFQNLPLPAAQEARDSSGATPSIVMENDGGFLLPSVVVFSWVHAITISSPKWRNYFEGTSTTQGINLSVLYGSQCGTWTNMDALMVYDAFQTFEKGWKIREETILKAYKCCTSVNKAISEILNWCYYFLSNPCIQRYPITFKIIICEILNIHSESPSFTIIVITIDERLEHLGFVC